MYPTSSQYLAAKRASHTWWSTATHRNLITGVTTTLDIEGGSVTDDVTSDTRRSLQLTLPQSGTAWDLLNTQGGEISVAHVTQYVNGATETIPMGVFIVDQEELGYTSDGQISMTCPDRWLKVQRNRFGLSRSSVPSNAAWQEIKRLIEGAWPGSGAYGFPGWASGSPGTTATTAVGSMVWDDGDRAGAVLQLVQANGLEIFPNRDGLFVLRPVPQLTPRSVPVWNVDASASGVMVDATRQRDRSNLRNAIIATTAATDIYFAPVEVKNTTVGDPLNVFGPLGYVAEDWSSAAFRNSQQAQTAAQARLSLRLGTAQSVSLTAVPNHALDAGDVIAALYPPLTPGQAPVTELHILDQVVHPLMPTDTQTMQTRSTRPLTDGS